MMDVSRRDFIKGAVATAAVAGLTPEAYATRWFGGTPNRIPKGKDMRIVCVGCAGKGESDIHGAVSAGAKVVGLCDVDRVRLGTAINRYPGAKIYKDYRKMFEDLGDQFDGVTISTPDHMHFPIAMLAMQMGKHIYVQKPCAHTIEEARIMQLAAKKYGVSTIMGNQGHATDATRRIYAWIRNGCIGNVREVHLYSDRPIWAQKTPWPATAPVPPTLDWNLWLGTAPWRPYPKGGMHFKWRGYWDFGCGAIGDMGCHIMDGAFWALDLRDPLWVEAESDAPDEDTTPTWSIVTYFFPANSWRPPVKMVWYDGRRPVPRPADLEPGRNLPNGNGQVFYGSNGNLMAGCYGESPRIFPEKRMKKVGRPRYMPPSAPDQNPHKEWVESCKEGGTPCGSNLVDYATKLTETALLGNLAIRCHRRIYWDAKTLTCIGDPEATKFVRCAYRVY